MKKRTLALMLAGIMALGTAGCSQSESTRSATAPAAQAEEVTGTVTIKLAHNMDFVKANHKQGIRRVAEIQSGESEGPHPAAGYRPVHLRGQRL